MENQKGKLTAEAFRLAVEKAKAEIVAKCNRPFVLREPKPRKVHRG